jgi:CheY-like chemotaxis protein
MCSCGDALLPSCEAPTWVGSAAGPDGAKATRRLRDMDTATPLSVDRSATRAPRVVVVDDEPAFRTAARRLLERRGYAVVAEAGSAATALDVVERFAPQAVLLDVRLGDDDGFEVCRRLTRARPWLAVLLASTGEYEQCDELVASSGARGFVSKTRLVDTDFGRFWPPA